MTTTLYRAWDEQGRLLYVGISDSVFVRLGEHDRWSGWAIHAASLTLQRFETREAAEAAEAEAIRTEDPVWNEKGRPLRRYLQWMRAYPDSNPDEVDIDELISRTRSQFSYASDLQGGNRALDGE